MKISYDPEVDALSITCRETTVTTKHLAEEMAADYDSEGWEVTPCAASSSKASAHELR